MIVTVPLRHDLDWSQNMFADITSKELLEYGADEHGQPYARFAVNLTADEQTAVLRRMTSTNTVEETLRARAEQATGNLLAYENLNAPTNAQTVAVIKLLCRAVRALIRLQLRQLNATD